MEEIQEISVEVFNQIHNLNREDFMNFHQIVSEADFRDLKIPFHSLDKCKTRALNIMIYYIISIQKNYNIFINDHLGDKYSAVCAKQISDYYIRNKFVIQEYEFSFLASKALNTKIQECAHIVYYLTYGRFASHPYINALCSKGSNNIKRKVIRKDYSLGNIKKRTINRQNTHEQFEVQNFRRDLKTALQSQKRCTLIVNNRLFDQQKIKENEKILSVAATQRKQLNRGSSLNTFIPHRISQGQNSLIFENLTYEKKFYQSSSDWNRKGLMRKQKFNQFFDINQLKQKTKLKRNPLTSEQNKQNFSRYTFQTNNDSNQINKINYQNFKRISTGLKTKSATLDKIRTECSSRNHKFNFEKQTNETLQETLQKLAQFQNQRTKQFRLMSKRVKNNLEHRNSKDMQNYRFGNNGNIQNGSQDNDLLKKQSIQVERNFECLMPYEQVQNQKRGDYPQNLLRNDHSHNHQAEDYGKKLQSFSQSKLGFRKFDSKNKLQKYKADYRKFLKTQTLDRIKQVG